MELKIYPLLNGKSQKLMVKRRTKYGKQYNYEPNGSLLKRIAQQTGMSMSQVREQIIKERKYLIQNQNASSFLS